MIHKCTKLPAERVMLEKKGAILEGWDADLVLFDYERLKDRAEYKQSNALSDGIEYVMVGGEIVYQNKQMTGKYPGKLIRHKAL